MEQTLSQSASLSTEEYNTAIHQLVCSGAKCCLAYKDQLEEKFEEKNKHKRMKNRLQSLNKSLNSIVGKTIKNEKETKNKR